MRPTTAGHERLYARHVPLEDLVHAGVNRTSHCAQQFDRSAYVPVRFHMPSFTLSWCHSRQPAGNGLGAAGCAAKRRASKSWLWLSMELNKSHRGSGGSRRPEVRLREFQQLLGELDGLEVGSLHLESPWDGKDEDLCDYLPNAPEDTPFFRCMRSEMRGTAVKAVKRSARQRAAGIESLLFRRAHHEGSGRGAGNW